MPNEPFILALETSGRIGSVALALGPHLLAETAFSAPMTHSSEIFPAISALLKRLGRRPSQIEHIYVSIGPGSFTGLRIAVTIAKAMHLARPVKIVAIDTLDVIAANVTDTPLSIETIATVLDAKRNQFFIATYKRAPRNDDARADTVHPAPYTQYAIPAGSRAVWNKLFPDSLMTLSDFLDRFANPADPIYLLGEGLLYHKQKFDTPGIGFLDEQYWSPRASKVHLLGWRSALAGKFADPLKLTPAYIRRPEAEEKWQQR
jgi:tRNA threonylcarbamoyladenosine biosynthesis protein TsaB